MKFWCLYRTFERLSTYLEICHNNDISNNAYASNIFTNINAMPNKK